jgi:hypothetical protein
LFIARLLTVYLILWMPGKYYISQVVYFNPKTLIDQVHSQPHG